MPTNLPAGVHLAHILIAAYTIACDCSGISYKNSRLETQNIMAVMCLPS